MLQAVLKKNAAEQQEVAKAAQDAEAAVAERFHNIGLKLHEKSMAKALNVSQRTQRIQGCVGELERTAKTQAAEANDWLRTYDRLGHGVQELGETGDWLQHIEGQIRSLAVELEHIHRQVGFTYDRKEPA
jgi:hypothetical protein|tara:strand:- start:193 stop:582 length:390 start_codon:yes stop_codon:yes gene_type:complete